MGLEDSAGLGVQNIGSRLRKNRMHGLMREGRRAVVLYPTHRNIEDLIYFLVAFLRRAIPPTTPRPASISA